MLTQVVFALFLAGIFIVKIHRDGAAFKDGRLRVGDKIISINDIVLDGLRHEEVGAVDNGDKIQR